MSRRLSLASAALVLGAFGCSGATPPPDLCASVTPDASMTSDASGPAPDASAPAPEAGAPAEDASAPVNTGAQYCPVCRDLSDGTQDRVFSARFDSEVSPVIAASRPGGPPIITPGALTNIPIGTLLRYAVAATDATTMEGVEDPDLAAVRELVDSIETITREAVVGASNTPPLAATADTPTTDDQVELAWTLGDACAGMLSLRNLRADSALASRVRALDAQIVPVIERAQQEAADFVVAQQFDAERIAIAGRMLATCGALTEQTAAVPIGLGLVTTASGLASTSLDNRGAFLDAAGRFDVNRQARTLAAILDTLRAVPQSACAERTDAVRAGAAWLAERVTMDGRVRASGSAATCELTPGRINPLPLNPGAVFRVIAESAAMFEPAPPSPLPPLQPADPWASVPLAYAAERMSAFARENPGAPACFE